MNPNERPRPMPAPVTHGTTHQPHAGPVTVTPAKPGKLLRLPAVEDRTGLKKTTIYAGMAAKTFPVPVRLTGGRAVAWREDEIDRWIAERVKKGAA